MKKSINILLLSTIILCGCNSGDGVVKKKMKVHLDVDKENEIEVCFFNNDSNIPYVEIKNEFDSYLCSNAYSCEQNNNDYTITNNANKATMKLNIESGDVVIDDVSKFRTPYLYPNGNYIDEFYFTNNDPKVKPINQERIGDKCKYDSTEPYKINIKDYGFAPVKYSNKGYLPIDVMPLIVSPNNGTFYLSNDEIYNINSLNSKLINSIMPKTSYSKSYYEYSYNILTLSIELYFGLKGYSKKLLHDGNTINYLTEGVIKEFEPYKEKIINSDSLDKFDEAINTLVCEKLLDGGHTYVKNRSFSKTKKEELPSDKECENSYKIDKEIKNYRKNSPNASDFPENENFNKKYVAAYDTNNDGKKDIGYFTFPGFETEDKDKQVSMQTLMRGADGANTLLNPKAKGYDSTKYDIKDVVIDLTVNSGGSVVAEGMLLSWICGGIATQTLKCSKGKTFSTFSYKFDVNGDGEFTEEDYLPDDVNVYILSSNTTYSAANALPYDSFLYNRDSSNIKKIILMGEKSAGGACSIFENLFLPTGLCYQISGCDVGIDPKDTSKSCESGVDPTEGYKIDRENLAIRTKPQSGTFEGLNSFIRAKHPLN